MSDSCANRIKPEGFEEAETSARAIAREERPGPVRGAGVMLIKVVSIRILR